VRRCLSWKDVANMNEVSPNNINLEIMFIIFLVWFCSIKQRGIIDQLCISKSILKLDFVVVRGKNRFCLHNSEYILQCFHPAWKLRHTKYSICIRNINKMGKIVKKFQNNPRVLSKEIVYWFNFRFKYKSWDFI
jgi:hypothetical protein